MLVDMQQRMVPGKTYKMNLCYQSKSWWTEPMKCTSCTEHSVYSVSYFMSRYNHEKRASCGMYYWQRRTTLCSDTLCVIGFEEVTQN